MSPNVKRYICLFTLSLGAAASYTLPYIKYIFYDAWVAGLGLPEGQNQAAGMLLTYHMIGCVLLYIPGGYIADKFSPKKILVVSLFGTGLLNIWYSFDPSYETGRIIWFLLAFTVGFGYWSAMIKAVRMLGTPQEQGKMYGWYNSGEGMLSGLCLGVATFVFALSQVPLESLQYAVWVQAAFCFLAAIMTAIFFDSSVFVGTDTDEDKFKFKDVGKVISNPWVWCVSIVVLCCYGAYTSQSYLTPYMTEILQMTPVAAAVLGILRTKGARFIGGPIGGITADRLGSPGKVIIASNVIMIILLLMFFVVPNAAANAVFAVTLSMLVAIVNFCGYNIMFATIEEAHIPRYLTGTAVGIISMVGYTPDGFINTIFGNWMDTYGNGAYSYIFMAMIGMCAIGSFFCFLILRRHARILREQKAGQVAA